ncbi:MAG: GlsB/YeaQ/YmgE family stress response membrane protein [Roseiflexaceae bacterium]
MGIVSWVIFGALAGWVASIIAGTNGRQGCITNIVIGIVGAFLGGLVIELLTGNQFIFDFNMRSFIVAVLGSIGLLAITGWGRRRSRR